MVYGWMLSNTILDIIEQTLYLLQQILKAERLRLIYSAKTYKAPLGFNRSGYRLHS
jgi:hypothetical protein